MPLSRESAQDAPDRHDTLSRRGCGSQTAFRLQDLAMLEMDPGWGVKARVWGRGHGREHVRKLEATLNLGGKVRRGRMEALQLCVRV